MRWLAALLLMWLAVMPASAAPHFPALTGRVVDKAQLLPPTVQSSLERELAAQEQATGHQLVVVTVTDLQGLTIEEYGYQLGRFWGIGQKAHNNGVLLIVAPSTRAVRIEVGYGLEGVLTDARGSQIIQNIMLPAFRRGDMAQGMVQGAQAIGAVIGGEPLSMPPAAGQNADIPSVFYMLLFLVAVFFHVVQFVVYVAGCILAFPFALVGLRGLERWLEEAKARYYPAGAIFLVWLLTPTGRFIMGGRARSGGNFRGGGGGFGGGGGSGRW